VKEGGREGVGVKDGWYYGNSVVDTVVSINKEAVMGWSGLDVMVEEFVLGREGKGRR